MPWSEQATRRSGPLLIFGLAVCCLLALRVSGFEEKRLSVYSSGSTYSIVVVEHSGADYVSLQDILQPLGAVTVRVDGRTLRLRFNNLDGEFREGKIKGRIQGRSFDLPAAFLLEQGRGLVPLASLPTLLPRFLRAPANLHESARRLFIGNVAVHFTAQVNKTNPPSLVMQFSSPVNPTISTEPGGLRMVFAREPLVPPGSLTLTFDSQAIPSATFDERNGAAEIAVNGRVPLFASFGNEGRTITIMPAPQAAGQVNPPPVPPSAPVTPNPSAPAQPGSPLPPAATSLPAQYFAVVDASHGGDERGAALSDQLAEKDVTLAFALRLQQELQSHNLPTLLLRDNDTTLSLDQRANLTNVAHPAVYICLHATSQGTGVRLYTALLPSGGENRGPFLDFETAQQGFRAASQVAESSLATEFGKRQVPVRSLTAPLRPLNNITAAAVAIEIAAPAGKIADLNTPAYQQLVAEAVTVAIEGVRDQLRGPK
jgi:N-acetylmuramoyl-L-alanine amidase